MKTEFKPTEAMLRQSSSYLRAKKLVDTYCINQPATYFVIPVLDCLLMDFTLRFIEQYCRDLFQCDFFCVPYYNKHIVYVFRKERNMKYKITFEIPYGSRSKYADELFELNRRLDQDDVFGLFVNNTPYSLESIAVVETNQEEAFQYVQAMLLNHGLRKIKEKGLHELTCEVLQKHWNVVVFPPCNRQDFLSLYQTLFWFEEKDILLQKGYTDKKYFRSKVFISYCHDQSKLVNNVIQKLDAVGMNDWIDVKDLQSGIPLLRTLIEEIAQSDVAVSFVSKSMVHSIYAQEELNQIMDALIKKESKWSFVKVDDVDVNQVYPRLESYFYIDYAAHQDVDEIVADICKKV